MELFEDQWLDILLLCVLCVDLITLVLFYLIDLVNRCQSPLTYFDLQYLILQNILSVMI